MNKRITVAALVLALGIGGAQAMRAEAAATEPKPQGDLTIVVVESLEQGPGRLANFDRMSEVFTDVFTARKWPLNIKIERFASTPKATQRSSGYFTRAPTRRPRASSPSTPG